MAWRRRRLEQGLDKPPTEAQLQELSPEAQLAWKKSYERWMSRPRRFQTTLHKRSVLSLAPLLLGAIAVPLGIMTRRGRRLVAFALAIAVVLGGYYPLMAAGTALGESGIMSPAAAMWGVSVVCAVVAVTLFRKMLKW